MAIVRFPVATLFSTAMTLQARPDLARENVGEAEPMPLDSHLGELVHKKHG